MRLCQAFADGTSANIKLSNNQFSGIGQEGGFSGRHLESLLKAGFSLMKNVLRPLAKSVLIPLGLTAAVSASDKLFKRQEFLWIRKVSRWRCYIGKGR